MLRSHRSKSLLFGCAVIYVVLFFSLTAMAQLTTADLVGTVTDPTGAAIPGATVTATNHDTQLVFTAVSLSGGEYSLRLLPPGHYTIRAQSEGFKIYSVQDVTLAVGDRFRLELPLEVGQQQQLVEVVASTPALQSETSNIGTLISQRAVQDLPLNGRNFINLARLTVGASESTTAPTGTLDDRRQPAYISINGQATSQNNFLLDGMDDNERFNGLVVVKPPIEAIQEMKVETNKYSAEFGRTSGGVINLVTKSGSNSFHGSVFEFFRNEKFDARNFFAKEGVTPKPAFKQNQFGGSFGGPIQKNKTFFFADYSGLRVRQGITSTVAVPTANQRAGIFTTPIYNPLTTRPDPTSPGRFIRDLLVTPVNGLYNISAFINPVSRNVLALWPSPNAGTTNTFTQIATRPQRDDSFDVRLDRRIGMSDSVFFRYSFNDTTSLVPSTMPVVNGINPGNGSQAGGNLQRSQSLGINYVHSFNQALLMELKLGYNRFVNRASHTNDGNNASQQLGLLGVNFGDQDTSGLATFTGFSPGALGDAAFIPTICINNIYHVIGNVSYAHTEHTIKTGGELRWRQVAMFQSNNPKPAFSFDNTVTNNPANNTGGDAFASFLLGYPAQTQRNKYLATPIYLVGEVSWFAQDDWRPTRWLTLNLGARWDYYGPASEKRNRIANVDLTTGQMLIAGQNGVSKNANVVRDLNNWAPRFGFAATITPKTVLRGGFGISYVPGSWNTPLAFRNPPFVSLLSEVYAPVQYATNPIPLRSLSTPLPALTPAPTSPATVIGNLAPVAFDLRVPYVQQVNLALQHELPGQFVVMAAYVGGLTRKLITSLNMNQLNPGETVRPFASLFPSLGAGSITPSANRLSNNYSALQLVLERRFSRGLGFQSNYTYSHNLAYSAGQARGTLDKGNGGLDLRQRFTLAANYELPFFNRGNGILHAIAGGWQTNGVFVKRTGFWGTVTNLSPRTGLGTAVTGTGGGGGVADRPNVVANPNPGPRTVDQWFNTAAFVGQTIGTYGNEKPGSVEGPGTWQIDFSLFKNFSISENANVQFRAEAFNLFNHPNFDMPNLQLGNSIFGRITTANNNLPRNVQFALKFTF